MPVSKPQGIHGTVYFFLTSQMFFFIPCELRRPLPQLCLLSLCSSLICTSRSTRICPLTSSVSSTSGDRVRPLSTLFQNCAGRGCATTVTPSLFCISSLPDEFGNGIHLFSSSSVPNIVRDWLSVPVSLPRVLMPRVDSKRRAKRLRLEPDPPEPEPGVAVEETGADLKAEEPGRSGLLLRHMCQMIGRLVQRMPPRGSKAAYAPRGT
jgi:hypothetical protein